MVSKSTLFFANFIFCALSRYTLSLKIANFLTLCPLQPGHMNCDCPWTQITEMESGSTRNVSRFGLAILDIDNLRGHIQSPLQKQNPHKSAKPKATKLKASSRMKKPHKSRPQKDVNDHGHDQHGHDHEHSPNDHNDHNDQVFGVKTHKKQSSSPNLARKEIAKSSDDEDGDHDGSDDGDTDDDDHDEDSVSASPLSEVVDHISPSNGLLHDDELEMKYIDDEDLQRTITMDQKGGHNQHGMTAANDDDESSDDGDGVEPQSAAERTAAINHQRRKSSLLLQQKDLLSLQQREAMKAMAAMNEHKEESPMGIDGRDRGDSENSPRSVPDGVDMNKKR